LTNKLIEKNKIPLLNIHGSIKLIGREIEIVGKNPFEPFRTGAAEVNS
jgi:hypothetical protein